MPVKYIRCPAYNECGTWYDSVDADNIAGINDDTDRPLNVLTLDNVVVVEAAVNNGKITDLVLYMRPNAVGLHVIAVEDSGNTHTERQVY